MRETMKVEANERHRRGGNQPDPGNVRQAALRFVQEEAGFAQVFTINRHGFPVGRTMVAVLNDDWTVDLVQRNVHRRLGQLRRNPRLEVLWSGAPRPESVNDRPHVYDVGWAVPRAVFVRGLAEVMSQQLLVQTYEQHTARQRAKGLTKAPRRSPAEVSAELVGLRVSPLQVRAEGFGLGAASFTWTATGGGPR